MKKDIFDAYADAIANKFHLTLGEMYTKTRKREVVEARQMLYFLAKERPIRLSYIKRFMEENGHAVTHSNILYSYKKAKELIDGDADFQNFITEVLKK